MSSFSGKEGGGLDYSKLFKKSDKVGLATNATTTTTTTTTTTIATTTKVISGAKLLPTHNDEIINKIASTGKEINQKILRYLDCLRLPQEYKYAFADLGFGLDEAALDAICKNSESLSSFLTDRIKVVDNDAYKELLSNMLTSLHRNKNECLHLCIEKWKERPEDPDGPYVCIQCYRYLNCPGKVNNIGDAARDIREREIEAEVNREIEAGFARDGITLELLSTKEQQEKCGKLSQFRGVTIGWLKEFTNENRCWDMTTQEVCVKFVFPATAARRCRYVELDHMINRGIVGPASTFISHCRGGTWGDLVAAVLDGGADINRRVWIDIFACRQWSCAFPDMGFDYTIGECSSFLVVCSNLKEVERLNSKFVKTHADITLTREVKNKIAFLRVWCLVEIFAASRVKDMPIIMKGGSHVKNDAGNGKATDVKFVPNKDMLDKMVDFIDIRNANATIPSDKEMILGQIREESDGSGIEKLNYKVRGAIWSSHNLAGPIAAKIENAACGDERHLNEQVEKKQLESLKFVCAGGFMRLLRDYIFVDCPSLNPGPFHKWLPKINSIADKNKYILDHFYAAFYKACEGGHTDIVDLFIKRIEDVKSLVNYEDNTGNPPQRSTPLIAASRGGFADTSALLIANGANVNVNDSEGKTALTRACKLGHAVTINLLIEKGGNVNTKDNYFLTPLMRACKGGFLDAVILLVKAKANVNAADKDGKTVLMYAAQGGNIDIVKYLLESGAKVSTMISAKGEKKGKTALDIANESNHADIEILRLLLDPRGSGGGSSGGGNGGGDNIIAAAARLNPCPPAKSGGRAFSSVSVSVSDSDLDEV